MTTTRFAEICSDISKLCDEIKHEAMQVRSRKVRVFALAESIQAKMKLLMEGKIRDESLEPFGSNN